MLIIKYKPKRLRNNLIFGFLWLVLAVLSFVNDSSSWHAYSTLFISFLYLGLYFYERKNQYLTIQDGQMWENHFYGKRIDIKEVKQFRSFAGDYIFETEKSKLAINTQIIEKESLKELNEELEKHNLNGNI